MLKKLFAVCLSLLICISFCGCDLLTNDTAQLLSPPKLSDDLQGISQAIKESVKGEYTFEYPLRGEYRSAVIQEDIDFDGTLESFAFYSTADAENITMNINAVIYNEGEWKSVAQQKIVAGGVDKVIFCDIDNDGVKEIIVGWQIYGTSEMQMAIYTLKENSLIQRMLQKYTHFTVCDLDEDGKSEVLVIKTDTTNEDNLAQLYSLNDEGIIQLASCKLDKAAKTVNEPIISTLSNGKPAIYIDEIKGVGAVTEVLYMEKGALLNPLLETETGETLATLRSVSLNIKDINDDGILEIPIQTVVPSVSKSIVNEKLYITDWCSFNGDILISQMTTIMNMEDRYYYIIPPKFNQNIAIYKDTVTNLREIYKYNSEDLTVSHKLISFKVVKLKDWESEDYKKGNSQELLRSDNKVYICTITPEGEKEGLTYDSVRESFKLITDSNT